MTYSIPTNGVLTISNDSNSSGNTTRIEPDGTVVFLGNATVWDDLRIPLYSRGGGSAPSFSSGFAGNSTLYTWNFAGNATQMMYLEAQMPHSWNGTTIYPHVHWAPATTGTGSVVWYWEYVWVNVNGTYGASSTLSTTSTLAAPSQWKHIIAGNPTGIAPSQNQNSLSSVMIGRLYRIGGGTGDTYTGSASLLSIDIHYELDTIGSRDTITK
jgi:hypothetical protein